MLLSSIGCITHAQEITPSLTTPENVSKTLSEKTAEDFSKSFDFSYTDTDLVTIISELATLKNINVVFPQTVPIKAKVTLTIQKDMTIERAWDLIITLLDIAGYCFVPQGNMYVIVKKDKDISKVPLPVFIGTDPTKLPETDQRIRYLYYLSNIKVGQKGDSQDTGSEISEIIKTLLPLDSSFLIDESTNSLLLIASSNDIRTIMNIITQLDKPGFQEKMELIHLRHSSAETVSRLFNESILRTEQNSFNRYRLDGRKPDKTNYFAQNTRIIPEPRTNSLILIGRAQAVNRIKDFIFEYIDVELDSGKSILHVYELQYLDATEFSSVLRNIVDSSRTGGTGQSSAGASAAGGNVERYFEEVIIEVDRPRDSSDTKYYGSNKLIIAARNDDWKRIKKLIEQLDTPQRQVLIEVLIADLTINDNRILGSMLRNPSKIPMPGDMTFQASPLNSDFEGDPGIIPNSWSTPHTIGAGPDFVTQEPIASDVLRANAYNAETGAKTDGGDISTAGLLRAGSGVISISDADGKTWSITQILKFFGNTKIISHPHVVATDNKEAVITIKDSRLVPGEATNTSGNPIRKIERIDASLIVKITPRVSGSFATVNLNVDIDVDEFTSASTNNNTRITRTVKTNANVNTGDILALGGLIKINSTNGKNETPFFSKIPVIGSLFFKKRSQDEARTNLTVFITPTIIEPRLRNGINSYTRDYINVAKDYSNDGVLFDTLKDPINRWFFKTGNETINIIDEFEAQHALLENNAALPQAPTDSVRRAPALIPEQPEPVKHRKRWRSRQDRRKESKKRRQERIEQATRDKQKNANDLQEKVLLDKDNPFASAYPKTNQEPESPLP